MARFTKPSHITASTLGTSFMRSCRVDSHPPHSEHVSADDPVGSPGVLGLALDDCAAKAPTSFRLVELADGLEVESAAWSWRPGSIFLGLHGALTQHEPESGHSERIGVALSAHRMRVDRAAIFRGDHITKDASAAAPTHPQF